MRRARPAVTIAPTISSLLSTPRISSAISTSSVSLTDAASIAPSFVRFRRPYSMISTLPATCRAIRSLRTVTLTTWTCDTSSILLAVRPSRLPPSTRTSIRPSSGLTPLQAEPILSIPTRTPRAQSTMASSLTSARTSRLSD